MIPANKKIVYVSRDIERALGLTPAENYLIVSNKTPYSQRIHKQYPDSVILIENPNGEIFGTTELLGHEITKKIISDLKTKVADSADQTSDEPFILVFKNTLRDESVIKANNWKVLNPPSNLAERVENKLSQIRWLGEIGTKYLPSHAAKVSKQIVWKNDPFIIQWAHGHTGDGTLLVRNREDLTAIQEKFPERMARLSTFIAGPSFTVNAIVAAEKIMMGNISYQITGLPPFTDNEFSTIGNDWGLAKKLLTAENLQTISKIVEEIGNKLRTDGWRGLFGVDLIREEKTNKIYLIEVNARQPASTTFESTLQDKVRRGRPIGLTTFEAHLRALLGLPIDQDLVAIEDGAQIVQRATKNIQSIFDDVAGSLELAGYEVVSYENTTENADLIRIQSKESIMEGHGILNAKGREIAEIIKTSRCNLQV
jgi:hypothetical protein